MKKFLRVTAAVSALVLAAGCFTGCGKKNESTENADNGGVTTVTIWSGDGHSKEVYENMVNDYNNGQGKEDGVKIEFTYIANTSFSQSIELALQNGTAPDLMSSADLTKNIEEGKIMPISDLPGSEKFLDDYRKFLADRVTDWDGKTYRVPTAATTMGLAYNTDMFKAAGIVDENGNAKPPKTLTELRETAKKLTDASKKQYGIVYPAKGGTGWVDSEIIYPAATNCGHLDYDYVNGKFDFSQTKPFIECVKGIIEDGSCFPGMTGIDDDTARAYFAEGKIGMKTVGSYDVGVLRDQFPAKCNWEVAPLPVADENNLYKQRTVYGYSFLINSNATKKISGEKLMHIYEYFVGKEAAIKLYKNGISIPCDTSWIKDVKSDEIPKQWKQFTDMVDISTAFPGWPARDSANLAMTSYDMVDGIINGKFSVDEGIAQYNKAVNDASARYYQDHPDAYKKPEDFIIPDWNAKR